MISLTGSNLTENPQAVKARGFEAGRELDAPEGAVNHDSGLFNKDVQDVKDKS